MKVLVTGGTGFLGWHLCAGLMAEGHEVTVLRRGAANTAGLLACGLRYVLGDITDPESVRLAVDGQEIVIHAAGAIAYASRQEHGPVNEGGTRNVVTACSRLGVRRLVHISSVAAIGIPEDRYRPADEAFVFNLDGSGLSYHISKRRAEQVVARAVAGGLDAVVVNPSSINGPHGRDFRGRELPDGVRRRSVVPCFAGGTNVVHVEDVVQGVLAALCRGRAGERYILGGENLTWREMAKTVAEMLAVRRIFVAVPAFITGAAAWLGHAVAPLTGLPPRFSFDVHFCANRFLFYDSRKAAEQLGFKPRPYAAIVREYLAGTWFRAARTSKP
jgi:dihydroflavonol-4-reductase